MAKTFAYGEFSAEKTIFNNYLSRSKYRGIRFKLSFSFFRKLISQNCFYCGTKPLQVFKRRNVFLLYNGIDRLRNESGYTKDNTVPCCGYCNSIKSNFSLDRFVYQISLIHNNFLKGKK